MKKKYYITRKGKITTRKTKTRYYTNKKRIGMFEMSGGAGFSATKGLNKTFDVDSSEDLKKMREITKRIYKDNETKLSNLTITEEQFYEAVKEQLSVSKINVNGEQENRTIKDALKTLTHTKAFGAEEKTNFQDYLYEALKKSDIKIDDDKTQKALSYLRDMTRENGKYKAIDKSKFEYVGNRTYTYEDYLIEIIPSPERFSIHRK